MLPRRFRRSRLRRLLNAALLIISVTITYDVLSLLKNYREFSRSLVSHTYTDASQLPSSVKNQKIFICAQFWTNALVIEKRWGAALLNVVAALGAENVYISIYESGSLDHTKEVLAYLDSRLVDYNIRHTITLDPTTHEDEINAGPHDEKGNARSGWVQPPNTSTGKELRRIPYLARLRNLSLKPLFEEKAQGRTYDKILFLNDVVFRPSDVLSLLATNQGSYAAACAFDYHYPASMATYYDTFALRDINGDGTATVQFPYFRADESRNAILRGASAKVQSCWNGIIFMDAGPFYPDTTDKTSTALTFRAIPDSLASNHLEGSECCLIHADMTAMGAASKGIYVNPAVRVGYTELAYEQTHFGQEETFLTGSQYVRGVWFNRFTRLTTSAEKQMRGVNRKVEQWKKEKADDLTLERREEIGQWCLIDEMHLLIWNGWKHA